MAVNDTEEGLIMHIPKEYSKGMIDAFSRSNIKLTKVSKAKDIVDEYPAYVELPSGIDLILGESDVLFIPKRLK